MVPIIKKPSKERHGHGYVGIQIWLKIELGYLHGYMMIYDDILGVYHVCMYIYIYIYYASVANLSCMRCK